jgi:DNA-binding MarR family transcriptional regulator
MRHTGFLISRMGMVAQKQFQERLEALGLTTRMWGALNVLDHEGPISQQALGSGIGMDPSSMVATIDELEARGLVERRRHPSDRRAHALHLTDQGRETLARGRMLAKSAQEDLLAPLNPAERKQLHELLLRIALATSEVGKEMPPAPPAAAAAPAATAPAAAAPADTAPAASGPAASAPAASAEEVKPASAERPM